SAAAHRKWRLRDLPGLWKNDPPGPPRGHSLCPLHRGIPGETRPGAGCRANPHPGDFTLRSGREGSVQAFGRGRGLRNYRLRSLENDLDSRPSRNPSPESDMPREVIILECTEAKAEGARPSIYPTTRNTRTLRTPRRLETVKFYPYLKRRTLHREKR